MAAARRHPRLRGDRRGWRGVFCPAGATRLRLTGGEPLLRRDLPLLVGAAGGRPSPWDDLALTTNGILLAPMADDAEGRRIAADHREPRHARRRAIPRPSPGPTSCRASARASTPPRASSPASRSTPSSCAASTTTRSSRWCTRPARLGAEIRFIEYMDVGGATRWTTEQVVSRADILAIADARVRRAGAARRRRLGAGGAVPAAARTGDRRHRVDDRAVLRDVRPQPADGRRHVVPLPLRDQRHRPARAGPRRRDRRAAAGAVIAATGRREPIKARRIGCGSPTGGRSCR